MPILIDGHNLIGAGVFSDIHLSDEDDEAKLVARLKVWKSRYHGKMTVIFDGGIPGGVERKLGGAGVEVVFASGAAEADDLIRRRLRRHAQRAGAPRGHPLVLVSNDESLINEAAAHGIETMRGADFVDKFSLDSSTADEAGTEIDVQLSESEVDEWLALFAQADEKPTNYGRDTGEDGQEK